MIDHKQIKLPVNMVLIKPKKNHTHFHVNGKEFLEIGGTCLRDLAKSDDMVSDMKETNQNIAHSWSTIGEVFQVPDKTEYHGAEIQKMYGNIYDSLEEEKYYRLCKSTMKVASPMELKIGDEAMFFYNSHITAREEGRCIDTDIGEMYLIKYDELEAKVVGDTLYPLNGYIFFEEIEENKKFGDIEIISNKEMYDRKSLQKGKVIAIGSTIGGTEREVYIQDPTAGIEVGTTIYFKGYDASEVEADNHFIYFGGRKVFKIRRPDILLYEDGRV